MSTAVFTPPIPVRIGGEVRYDKPGYNGASAKVIAYDSAGVLTSAGRKPWDTPGLAAVEPNGSGQLVLSLTNAESEDLAACEALIERGRQTFIDVGTALLEIRDRKLYRGTHSTFEAYVRERWEMTRPTAYRMMEAAEVVSQIETNGPQPNQAQARELAALPPSERQAVWTGLTAPGEPPPTAERVRRAVAERRAPEPFHTCYGCGATAPTLDGWSYREADGAERDFCPKCAAPEAPKARTRKPATMQQGHSDEFQTPPEALAPLLRYLPPDARVWECAWGQGALGDALSRHGFTVVGEKRDFLTDRQPDSWDVIVTNPPYSLKDEFLARAYALGKPFAFLLPLTALEGQARQALQREHGVEVLVLRKRPKFTTPSGKVGGSWFPCAWFTWGLGIGAALTFAGEPKAEAEEVTPTDDGEGLGHLTIGSPGPATATETAAPEPELAPEFTGAAEGAVYRCRGQWQPGCEARCVTGQSSGKRAQAFAEEQGWAKDGYGWQCPACLRREATREVLIERIAGVQEHLQTLGVPWERADQVAEVLNEEATLHLEGGGGGVPLLVALESLAGFRATLDTLHAGLLALKNHHRDEHHGGADLLLDETVANAFLAYRAARAVGGDAGRGRGSGGGMRAAPTDRGGEAAAPAGSGAETARDEAVELT